ncbi:MAG: sigma-54 dependent transcriptional regulator [bacterium]
MEKILVVDDQRDLRWILFKILKAKGYKVAQAENGPKALSIIKTFSPDVVLLDNKMPGGMDGIEVLENIHAVDPNIIVIILTAYGDIKMAVRAMKLGAYDFMTKPFEDDELLLTLGRALEKHQSIWEIKELRGGLHSCKNLEVLMGTSEQIQRVYRQIERVAPTDLTVLIQGETGTGKELVARALHEFSLRKDGPFVAVDCGAIPDTLVESELFGYEKGAYTDARQRKQGQFELANHGTIFLDEISNLPYSAQRKLLRVIEERKLRRLGAQETICVDVRIVAASNSLLEKCIEKGEFRRDLYYRLNKFPITLPTLRNRKEDIPFLAEKFLQEAGKELKKKTKGLSKEAIKSLLLYNWKGNVRELKNIIHRAVLLADGFIEPCHLIFYDKEIQPPGFENEMSLEEVPLKEIIKRVKVQVEKKAIENALKKVKGNKSQAAKILDVDYKTLHTKIKNYGIEAMDFRP